MNDWPPPSVSDAPSVPPTVAVATPWSQRPLAKLLLVVWVAGGLVVLVVIGVRGSGPESRRATLEPVPKTAATSTPTTARGSADGVATTVPQADSDIAPTTAPLVRSAPPIAPVPDSTASGQVAAPETTLVVTLPPSITVASPPPTPGPAAIDIEIRFDADGDDAANLRDEWVRFTNAGATAVEFTNWIVRDDGLAHVYVFGELTLQPGDAVTLFSACGDATASERYFWASGGEIWNNDGDVVSLFDDRGALIAQRRG